LIDFTRDKWGLENYYLHTHNFYCKLNTMNETVYTLSMEWFPSHITDQEDEDCNPDGTAAIDLNVNKRQFESVIFVGGKTFANRNVIRSLEVNDIIKFIEDETGLTYGNHFQLQKEEEKEFYFQNSINGVAVSPYGTIEIQFDQEGKMTYFSIIGPFPSNDKIKTEDFSLKYEDVEQVGRGQLELITFPSDKQKKFIQIYCIEEIYITNNQSKTIPFNQERLMFNIDERIHWESSKKKSFKRKQMNLIENVTADQVFACEAHPDLIPITDSEKKKCIFAIKDFLCRVYPDDSGKWIVKTLHREESFIIAKLKVSNHDSLMFQRKLRLFIDSKTYKVLNYMDNKPFLEMYEDFQKEEDIVIPIDKAYELLKPMIYLKPVYVYDFEQNKYILCGKIDSDFGINGSNGEIVNLYDL
ncbi:MAG: hypothetical protein ACJ8MO_15260, partial [Bacillus sp. (in: firmicutes)]